MWRGGCSIVTGRQLVPPDLEQSDGRHGGQGVLQGHSIGPGASGALRPGRGPSALAHGPAGRLRPGGRRRVRPGGGPRPGRAGTHGLPGGLLPLLRPANPRDAPGGGRSILVPAIQGRIRRAQRHGPASGRGPHLAGMPHAPARALHGASVAPRGLSRFQRLRAGLHTGRGSQPVAAA